MLSVSEQAYVNEYCMAGVWMRIALQTKTNGGLKKKKTKIIFPLPTNFNLTGQENKSVEPVTYD